MRAIRARGSQDTSGGGAVGVMIDNIRENSFQLEYAIKSLCARHDINEALFVEKFKNKAKELPTSPWDFFFAIKVVFDSDFRYPHPKWLDDFCAELKK